MDKYNLNILDEVNKGATMGMNDTTSKLAELLMQGTNMGIIEGRRLLNQNSVLESDVENILNDFIVMQEDSVETLKKYL